MFEWAERLLEFVRYYDISQEVRLTLEMFVKLLYFILIYVLPKRIQNVLLQIYIYHYLVTSRSIYPSKNIKQTFLGPY